MSGSAEPRRLGKDATVLIVDPDPASCDFCRKTLEDAGYHVEQSTDSAQVFGVIERKRPDVILIEVVAGTLAALLSPMLLKEKRATSDVSVILVLPSGEELKRLRELKFDIDGLLTKPIREQELLLCVRTAMRLRKHRLELLRLRELNGERARWWYVLLDFSRSVGRDLDLDTVLERVVTTAAEMTCSRRVSLMLPDEGQEFLSIVKAIGFDEVITSKVRLRVGDAIAGRAFASGQRLTSMQDLQRSEHPEAYIAESFVSMPIVTLSLGATYQRVGVLNLTDRYGDSPFEEWELEFIEMLGSLVGTVIDDKLWRQARESLLKHERDLQIARRIQQSTFPHRIPELSGFEIDAWSEPAEETGGDIYDIVGYERDRTGGTIRLSSGQTDRAVLLFADATGHGIGPALSVTQVRAMLRMAVRITADLSNIAWHINEQLHADLPGGRFITAWLGELNAADRTLTCFSAGQAPILRYDAARHTVEHLAADAIPFGINADLDVAIADPIPINPGDILAVISDGVFEAKNGAGRRFGVDRAVEVMSRHHRESARQIVTALRAALADFTAGEPAADDHTAILIKGTER